MKELGYPTKYKIFFMILFLKDRGQLIDEVKAFNLDLMVPYIYMKLFQTKPREVDATD